MKEKVLIDYLDDASANLRECVQRMQGMNREYRESGDRELRKDIDSLRADMRRKRTEILDALYSNMDELMHLRKYFPELLALLYEDEHIGKLLSKKRWLIERGPMKPEEAKERLAGIKAERRMLRAARAELSMKGRQVVSRQFLAAYPALQGIVREGMGREEAIEKIAGQNRQLRLAGWAVLLDSSLIGIPASAMFRKLGMLQAEEDGLRVMLEDAKSGGTVAEHNARKRLESAESRRKSQERKLRHLLLSNPDLLDSLKRKPGFGPKPKPGTLESFAQHISAKRVKERAWLDAMKKRLA